MTFEDLLGQIRKIMHQEMRVLEKDYLDRCIKTEDRVGSL